MFRGEGSRVWRCRRAASATTVSGSSTSPRPAVSPAITAVMAGLTAGLGLVLDPDTVVAEAARRQRHTLLPSPRNMPIDTFVVLMMENRSFDHYLGWLPNADGRQAGLHFTDTHGKTYVTHRLAGNYQGCAFLDPDHSWDGGRTEM